MESTEKLTDTNAILAYLYESFPQCFIAEGEVKPLKIGLFQDLAEKLADESKVSKTQLRVALRRYTSSWRYLKSIKAGAVRVDLSGEPCGELEEEHIAHAQKSLKESQERAKARRLEKAAKAESSKPDDAKSDKTTTRKPASKRPRNDRNFKQVQSKGKPAGNKTVSSPVNLVQAELSQLSKTQRVNVKLGKSPVSGVISEINKEEVMVQLDSGLTVKVKAEHILL
ncbi:RNA chaperone ProQ [Parashewanella spongiae]|uniref:RNA chaperone ProQ n=1 Tax=Parashewanella spongiae TaxID=342950 RepID=A0A3A6UC39_9GAMM|nr:RNA chaperone ProQ [Parashewanella spongiae]MCL1078483.1 RNA chaperone ProQ [Parashewanella spongiae]RJY14666.1 RNA chaperone ProQ [Parashewanella spongiae]